MFTGIVEEVGRIGDLQVGGEQASLRIEAQKVLEGVIEGDSINVDGVCLTVVSFDAHGFTVGLAPETLRRTAFSEREVGALVNLERAARVGDRLGGHYVQGHIDGVARIVERTPDGDSLELWF